MKCPNNPEHKTQQISGDKWFCLDCDWFNISIPDSIQSDSPRGRQIFSAENILSSPMREDLDYRDLEDYRFGPYRLPDDVVTQILDTHEPPQRLERLEISTVNSLAEDPHLQFETDELRFLGALKREFESRDTNLCLAYGFVQRNEQEVMKVYCYDGTLVATAFISPASHYIDDLVPIVTDSLIGKLKSERRSSLIRALPLHEIRHMRGLA